MSTLSYALTDSATMLRRNLRHMLRYPSMTLLILGMPVVFLLLFVYVFGGTLGAGLAGVPGDRAAYASYVAPGILLITVAAVAQGTAISVATDMTEGIVARFRTMAIWRASVLAGHVLGSTIQSVLSLAVVIGIALLTGFRPTAGPLGWLAALGVLVMTSFALTWLSVGLGLAAKTVETASNSPMFLLLLPFLSSAFVPTSSMPAWPEVVRRIPALHAGHRDPPRAAQRPPGRQQRGHRRRLVRRRHAAQLPVGEKAVQPAPGALTGRR